MIVMVAMFAGLAVAWALGAPLSALARLRFRGDLLVFGALGIQLAIFTAPVQQHVPPAWLRPLHISSYLLLLAFLALNLRIPGFWMVGVGVVLNVVVILLNGGLMPVSMDAWRATGADPAAILRHGYYDNNVLAGPHVHLAFLGDVFALPSVVPLANALSVGDVLVVLGVVAFVYRTCSPRPPAAVGATALLAPLRYSGFRRIVCGRATSKLGDWLTQAAAVTWIYSSTRSTFAVSAFLIIRMLGATLGGIAAAPILDRLPGFRLLTIVELLRGAAAVGMLGAAVGGRVWPVIALSGVSAFLGSATAPGASSLVPDLLPPDLVQAGNALHGVARNITLLVGALSGGFLVARFGIAPALGADVLTFVAAALLYSRCDGRLPTHAELATESPVGRREILRTLLTNRVVFGLTASFTVVTAAFGLLNSSLPQVFNDQVGDPHAYGYALAVLGGGLMCGEFLTGFIRRESVARRTVSLAFLLMGAIMFVIAHSHIQATVLLMVFLLGASDGTTETVYDTLMQVHTPRRMLAGVFALASSVQNTGMMLGLALAPFVLGRWGVPGLTWLFGGGCVAGGLVAAGALVGRRPAEDRDADVLRSRPSAVECVAAESDPGVTQLPPVRGPAVLVFGCDASDERRAMVEQLERSLGDVGARLARQADPGAERALGGDGFGGVWIVDGESRLCFAFPAPDAESWIPASFVLSRLRRLTAGRAAA